MEGRTSPPGRDAKTESAARTPPYDELSTVRFLNWATRLQEVLRVQARGGDHKSHNESGRRKRR